MAICRCEHLKPLQRLCLLRILYFTFRTSKPPCGAKKHRQAVKRARSARATPANRIK